MREHPATTRHMGRFRFLTWNTAGRTRAITAQAARLRSRRPDVVALQEIRLESVQAWSEQLGRMGLLHVATSFALIKRRSTHPARVYGELLASRWNLRTLPPGDFDIPWRERVLSAVVGSPWGPIEVHVAHLPAGVSHGRIKVATFASHPAGLAGCLTRREESSPNRSPR